MSRMLVMKEKMLDGRNGNRIKIKIRSSRIRPHPIIKLFSVHTIFPYEKAQAKRA